MIGLSVILFYMFGTGNDKAAIADSRSVAHTGQNNDAIVNEPPVKTVEVAPFEADDSSRARRKQMTFGKSVVRSKTGARSGNDSIIEGKSPAPHEPAIEPPSEASPMLAETIIKSPGVATPTLTESL